MAQRPDQFISNAYIRPYNVPAGKTVTVGKTAKFSGSDTDIEDAGANSDVAIGVVRPHPLAVSGVITGPMTAVEVVHPFAVVVQALVGSAGTTRGTKQIISASGFTDAPAANHAGATDTVTEGIALQTGVSGDLVGVGLVAGYRVTA